MVKYLSLILLLVSGCGYPTLPVVTYTEHTTTVIADSITTIQFCAGQQTTYPTTYPEYGLCINHEIYAVYWNNTAFLAKIVPGVYTTTSTGLNCTFTVSDNCEVH